MFRRSGIRSLRATYPPVSTAPPHPIAQNFTRIIEELRLVVAECGGRRRLAGPLTVRLWIRLGKISVLFAALIAHLAQFGADAPARKSPTPRPADAPRKPRNRVTPRSRRRQSVSITVTERPTSRAGPPDARNDGGIFQSPGRS